MTPRPTHELVWVSGSDAVSFLDSLLSQAIEPMAPGDVRRSFLLAPNGKVRALLWLLREGERVGVIADAGFGAEVVADLNRFKLRVDVEIGEPAPLYTVLDTDPEPEAAFAIEVALGEHRRVLTSDPSGAVDPDALDSLRVDAAEPVMGVDVDESTIPQETGLVPEAVDFEKGCYLGQELVARIDSRGHVNRRLVRVDVGEAAPPPGASVTADGADAGLLTTTAPGVGMGLLRRDAGPGERVRVTWEDGSAEGELIEFAPA